MPIREFTDAAGVRWRVWSTIPLSTGVVGTLRRGWLTFEAGPRRRRLAPIPDGWEDASDAELSAYCARAEATGRVANSGVRPAERDDR